MVFWRVKQFTRLGTHSKLDGCVPFIPFLFPKTEVKYLDMHMAGAGDSASQGVFGLFVNWGAPFPPGGFSQDSLAPES